MLTYFAYGQRATLLIFGDVGEDWFSCAHELGQIVDPVELDEIERPRVEVDHDQARGHRVHLCRHSAQELGHLSAIENLLALLSRHQDLTSTGPTQPVVHVRSNTHVPLVFG